MALGMGTFISMAPGAAPVGAVALSAVEGTALGAPGRTPWGAPEDEAAGASAEGPGGACAGGAAPPQAAHTASTTAKVAWTPLRKPGLFVAISVSFASFARALRIFRWS
jgi:hypothetical protein